ncbi:MAG TPA: hypothetical protein VFK11_02855 [Candidatus Saccharimonadales bacterium]|nr:hypothetical protein [Candidatus Saccharimonadales bacterium]
MATKTNVLNRLWEKFIRDEKGRTVLWQTPNFPLVSWAIFRLAYNFTDSGHLKDGLGFISSAFIFTWAYLEITEGASYFRKLLGAFVILLVILGHFSYRVA